MLELHLKSCHFIFGNDHQKTSMNSGSQSPKGILATNFAKTTHFAFFIVNYFRFLNGNSLRFN